MNNVRRQSIELAKAATEDEEWMRLLLQDPEALAYEMGVNLTDSEIEMLHSVTEAQLVQMIQSLTSKDLKLERHPNDPPEPHVTGIRPI